jgi:signal transduction histidine kinase
MTIPTSVDDPADRPSFRLTLRARLTLLYVAVFFAAGLILLVANYAVVSRSLENSLPEFIATVAAPPDRGTVTEGVPIAQPRGGVTAEQIATSETEFRDDTLSSLLQQSSLALLLVGIVAAAAAYAIAARTLAPVHAITATARRVASQNLHERIGLTGPRDEIIELAETFDDMLDRLDATFSSQRRFVANASHELRTPLATSRALLEVALADPDAPEQLRAVGDQLLAVNARSEQLIEGLLVLARSENELTESADVDLAAVVEHAADGLESEFTDAGVTLRQGLQTAVVRGSAVLLERLAVNLLQNAARHNLAGGGATVRTMIENGSAVIEVTNTGAIIPADAAGQLFEPFHRHGEERLSGHGVGLGLSIVRSVAEAHGGTVRLLTPAGGRGARFELVLPAARAPAEVPAATEV